MPTHTTTIAQSGQYLTFRLQKEKYAIEILKVREIIAMSDITPVPQTPHFIKGVINLRGKVIPVMDLRIKFSLLTTEYTRESCMIIVDIRNKQVALIVDAVHDVIEFTAEQISETGFAPQVNGDFISGVGKLGNEIVIILNIERVLTSEEFVSVQTMS